MPPAAAGKVIIPSLKNTEGYWALLSAAHLATGKPYKDAQYEIDAGFKKLATLKPNLLNVYTDAPQAINLLEQGEAQMIGGQFSAYTLIRKAAGSPVDLALPSDGAFAMPSGIYQGREGSRRRCVGRDRRHVPRPGGAGGARDQGLRHADEPGDAETRGLSRPEPTVLPGLGLLRQGARRMGGPLEPAVNAPCRDDRSFEALRRRRRCSTGSTSRLSAERSVTLLGPSGCGKTTLLRLIAGLMAPDEGSIAIGGVDVTRTPPHKRNVGVVFQNYALFPHLTVAGNVGFGLQGKGPRDAPRSRLRCSGALALVQMERFGDRPVRALSGGQQQRVALARALAVEPSVLLFDEALSALDRNLRETMQVELRRLLKDLGATAVFVTHDQDEALTMSDKVAVMNAGRIEQFD